MLAIVVDIPTLIAVLILGTVVLVAVFGPHDRAQRARSVLQLLADAIAALVGKSGSS